VSIAIERRRIALDNRRIDQTRTTMSRILEAVLNANAAYAADFDKGGLPMPPGRHFAILTGMDARLDPAKYAGLAEGDAYVIRNAGGRASDDAIRSLVISYKLLGTREWFVIHHTDCGMETSTDAIMRGLLASSLKTARRRCLRLARQRGGTGLGRGELRRLADHQGPRAERRRRCSAHPPASACSGRDPDLRQYLRRCLDAAIGSGCG
jgi:hypothetical protein